MSSPELRFRRLLDGGEKSVLDVGTGHGGVFDFGRWDSSKLELRVCSDVFYIRPDIPGWDRVRCDGAHLPFRAGLFDVVQSTEALEHVPAEDQGLFLEELARVSKRLVFVTTSGVEAHRGPIQEEYERRNPFQAFQNFLDTDYFGRAGFAILESSAAHVEAYKKKEEVRA